MVRTAVDGTVDLAQNVLTTCSTSLENCSYMKENFDSECPLFWSLPDLSFLLIGFSSAEALYYNSCHVWCLITLLLLEVNMEYSLYFKQSHIQQCRYVAPEI